MDKNEAMSTLTNYLRTYNINNKLINDQNRPVSVKDLNTVYMHFDVDSAPSKLVECCVWFHDDHIETRAYYTENAAGWCKKSNHIAELLEVINYINAQVFFSGLFNPRLFLVPDDCDIAVNTIIPYRLFEIAPVETCEHITGFFPEFLGKISAPIWLVVLGDLDAKSAISQIQINFSN